MKIFQGITVSEYGGAQSIVANLIKYLDTKHELFLLYGGEGEAWSSLGDDFTRIRLNKHRKAISLADIGLFFKLLYYRFKYKPDIIHLHSSKMGVLGRLAFSKKRTILTMHGFDSVRKNYRKFLLCEKFLQHKVGYIVAVCQYDVEIMKEENINKNVRCIYNGVPDLLHEELRYAPHIKDKLTEIKKTYPKMIMCVARISAQKRFDLFLEIAAALPQYAFVWIGNKDEIKNLPANTFCLGEIDTAHNYISFADIFILPSNYEGLPMTILEAMSFRKPIVASAVGGIPEVLNQGNGFAVQNTVKDFTEKIEYIFSSEEVYNDISAKSRKQYVENHTIEKMVSEYTDLYNQLLKKEA